MAKGQPSERLGAGISFLSCFPGTISFGFDGGVVQAVEHRPVAPETQVRILPLPPLC